METEYILSIDQSTSGTKALVIDDKGEIIHKKSKSHKQFYPRAGWVEHDPLEIYNNVKQLLCDVVETSGFPIDSFKVLSITNQRETVVVWNKETGCPVYNAIVWQCRRTTDICRRLKAEGYETIIQERTGLTIDPYFSATKMAWILNSFPDIRKEAEEGKLLFGTIDSWLIWKLTNGSVHATDVTNASRTLLFNIHTLDWDDELLAIFNIPRTILPVVKNCDEIFGEILDSDLPVKGLSIAGVIGDSQGALFGQRCYSKGMAKATFGTGTSVLINNEDFVQGGNGLVTSVAWVLKGKASYAYEGIINTTGDIIKWIQEDLGLIDEISEAEKLANELPNNEGVYLIPAFVGLGAPYWSPDTRAAITGMSRKTGKAHIVRAALESIAYQVKDIIGLAESECGIKIKELRVDGGATKNKFLMQFLADLLGITVIVSNVEELSTMGSAYLGGIGVGIWQTQEDISKLTNNIVSYQPSKGGELAQQSYIAWKKAVSQLLIN